ncbi:hypothetical protein SAY86_017768 [Trapa natans]|uniref:F-box domain-containing protein n=1 Tax=Trapa natans TaxID=22666 RepID=A0AAN7LRU6_TRANT|nr:hypothetical protein SAY86_016919 [Trapa natans]KAK4790464.1 hypothetical protein SAY86_017768 [Trapa natans]
MEIFKPNNPAFDKSCAKSRRARRSIPFPPDFMVREDLPEWLLEEILIRLPLSSVFRLRCVSREWLLRLSDPFFYRRYLSFRGSLPPSWTLLYGYSRSMKDVPKTTYWDRHSTGDVTSPQFSVLPSHLSLGRLRFLGCSNGLLLCCQSWRDLYYVYNPLTLQCISLPRRVSLIEPTREGLITKVEGDELKSYKVIQVGQQPESPAELLVDVFSSETGLWTNHSFCSSQPDHFPKQFPYFRFARAVTVKETVYLPDYKEGVLMAYSPYASPDQLSIFRLPDHELDRLPEWFKLCDAFGEKLRYYTVSEAWENPKLEVWELADPSNGGKWSLVHSCRWVEIKWEDARIDVSSLHRGFHPLCFHPSKPNVMYLWNMKCITAYDMEATRLEVFCEPDGSFRGLSWESVMPFVPPNWPISIPRATWNQEDQR